MHGNQVIGLFIYLVLILIVITIAWGVWKTITFFTRFQHLYTLKGGELTKVKPVDKPKTPLASASLTLRSSLRSAYRKAFIPFCAIFGHDYRLELGEPPKSPLLYFCIRCRKPLYVEFEEGEFTVRRIKP